MGSVRISSLARQAIGKLLINRRLSVFCLVCSVVSRVQHCVYNLVKEHSSRLTRLIFRDVAFNDDNVVYPELAA
jgi:hypothetical protein